MGYGEEIIRIIISSTTYVVHEDPYAEGSYDIHAVSEECQFRFFGTFDDPRCLKEDGLEELIRNALKLRTGIPG